MYMTIDFARNGQELIVLYDRSLVLSTIKLLFTKNPSEKGYKKKDNRSHHVEIENALSSQGKRIIYDNKGMDMAGVTTLDFN